ncbi:2207_t:CDS:2, partial [Funneliformis geosporum]
DAGIDKSRLLTEFLRIAQSAVTDSDKVSDLTVFLMIDDIQKLMYLDSDGFNKSGIFYSYLLIIASMVISNPTFIIAYCSATIVKPIVDILAKSQQLCVLLPFHVLGPPQHDGKNIFNIKHPLVRILVEDVGGNGYTLEALEIRIPADIDKCYIGELMHNIISDIAQLFSEVLDNSSHYGAILKAILGHIPIRKNEIVSGTP